MSEIASLPVRNSPNHREVLSESSRAFELVHGQAIVPGAKQPVPYSVALPYELQSDTLGIIVPGFGAIKRTSRGLRDAFANEGVATVSYDPARVHSSARDLPRHLLNPQELHYETLGAIESHIRHNIAMATNPTGKTIIDSKVTLIAHSMGGLPAPEFAIDNHEIMDGVMYIGAIGLEEPLGLKLIYRSKDLAVRDVGPGIIKGRYGHSPSMAKRSLNYFVRNPLRTAAEIVSCTRADRRPQVQKLAQLGVYQAVFCPEDDAFFYPEDSYAAVGDVVDHFEVIENCNHTGPQTKPEHVARVVGRVILKR